MGVKIYNEGRVVGYSAYELYVKHSLSEDPNTPPATELEWLSSTIAMGSSMLLKIPTDEVSGHHFVDFQLPEDTKLAAANTILGSLFLGEAVVDATGWAQKVTSYGPLLTNSSTRPTTGQHTAESTEYPTSLSSQLSTTQQKQILNYMKVVDGIVIQPGNWSATNSTPAKDMSPVLSERPRVRIFLSDAVKEAFYVLLTGFTLRTVLAGVSGLDGSTDTSNNIPEDGAFLGPGIFPWANKIVFSIPSMYATYFLDNKYSRKMSTHGNPSAKESSAKEVHRIPVIDMETTDPATYYASYFSDSRVLLDVVDLNKINGDAVLTVYQRDAAFPPALFGTKVTATGEQYASPLDTVAPGTMKMFNDTDRSAAASKAISFQDKIKNNYAFFRDTHDYVVRQINHTVSSSSSNWVDIPVADTYVDSIYGALEDSEVIPPFFVKQSNSGDPSDYAAVTTMYTRRIRGKVSDQFRTDFGIDPATTQGYNFLQLLMRTINRSDTNQIDISINHSMYDYIKDVPDWKSKYFFILQGSTTFNGNHVNSLTLVPVAKPVAGDVSPSNTFDYIYKSYGPQFKIPVLLPTSSTLANTAGSYGQYVGGYWNGEGPASHKSILEYLTTVCDINPVALMDYRRKVPEVDGYTDWRDAYSAITVNNFVSAVRADAVDRGVIPSSVTLQNILDGEYTYTYPTPDGSGNYRSITFQKIATQYRTKTLSEVFELAKFYDLSTGQELNNGISLRTHYAKVASIELTVNGSAMALSDAPTSVIDWDDQDSLYELTTSEPSDWSTRFRHYFTKSGSNYTKVYGDTAPTWAANTYYKPIYELSNIKYTDTLTFQTSVQKDSPKTIALPWPQDSSQYVFSSGPLNVTNVAGLHQTKALSVADSSGKIYDMSGEGGTITDMKDGNIHWDDILNALVNNKAIDVFNTTRFANEFYNRIVAGDGIKVTRDPNDATKTKISTYFAKGPGIELSAVTDAHGDTFIQITNTAMYPGSAAGYRTVGRSHYNAAFFGNFVSVDTGTSEAPGFEDITPASGKTKSAMLSYCTTSPKITVSLLPIFNVNGDVDQCYIKIAGSGSEVDGNGKTHLYHLGNKEFSADKFQLGHSNGYDGQPLSRIFHIQFKNEDWIYKGKLTTSQPADWDTNWTNYATYVNGEYVRLSGSKPTWQAKSGSFNGYYKITDHFNLSTLHSMNFQENGSSGNDIWNIRGMSRGSWTVICDLNKTSANDQHESAGWLVCNAGSISDGFNSQLDDLAATESKQDSDLFADWLNLFLQGMFY